MRQSFGRQAGPSPLPSQRSRTPSPCTLRSSTQPTQRRPSQLEKLRSSFSDRAAASVSIALEDPGSGVNPRRSKSTRTTRKAGVWNSVADLINTITHHKPDDEKLEPRSGLRTSKTATSGSSEGGYEGDGEKEVTPECWQAKPSSPANRRLPRWADFVRRQSDSPAPQRPPSTAPWARKSYGDPSDLYTVGPEDRFGPNGGGPNASSSPSPTSTSRRKMLSLRRSNRT